MEFQSDSEKGKDQESQELCNVFLQDLTKSIPFIGQIVSAAGSVQMEIRLRKLEQAIIELQGGFNSINTYLDTNIGYSMFCRLLDNCFKIEDPDYIKLMVKIFEGACIVNDEKVKMAGPLLIDAVRDISRLEIVLLELMNDLENGTCVKTTLLMPNTKSEENIAAYPLYKKILDNPDLRETYEIVIGRLLAKGLVIRGAQPLGGVEYSVSYLGILLIKAIHEPEDGNKE